MTGNIVGLDPSLVCTGLGLLSRGGPPQVALVRSTGRRSDDIRARSARITGLVDAVHAQVPPGALIVIEGPSMGSRGGSQWDRGGLWHRLVHALIAHRDVAVVPPATRAKWATGKGNADKAAVASVIARLCPDVELPTSDAADALCLALMGAHALGWMPDLATEYRFAALLKCEWPAGITERLLEPFNTPPKETR